LEKAIVTTIIRIIHGDKVITSFVRYSVDYGQAFAWREKPVVSDHWTTTDARNPISPEISNRGVSRGMLDKQANSPRYYGLPYLMRPGASPVKLYDGPTQWSFVEDGKAMFSTPRDGDTLPGHDGVIEIKYQFPDGGQPIWHHTLAPALDIMVAAQPDRSDRTLADIRDTIRALNRRRARR
jgi:hypothetical protein